VTGDRALPGFFGALTVDAVGSGLFVPASLLFFPRVTDLSLATIGVLLSVATLATLPLPPLAGVLVDRYRARNVVLLALLCQALGTGGYLLARDPAWIFVVVLVAATGNRLFWCSVFTLAADLPADGVGRAQQDRRFALVGMAQSAGFGVGAAGSGLLLAVDSATVYQALAAANAGSYLLAAVAIAVLVPAGAREPGHRDPAGGYRVLLADRPYLALIVVNTVFALCAVWLGSALPVYLVEGVDAPGWLVSPVLAANTAVQAVGQAWAARRLGRLSRVRALVFSGGLWTVWAAGLAVAVGVPRQLLVPYVLLVTACYTAAELIHAPVSNALAAAAAPAVLRGRYLAAFQYCFALASVLAPGLFGLTFALHPAAPWAVLALLAAAGSLGMSALEHRLPPDAVHGDAVSNRPPEAVHGDAVSDRPPDAVPDRSPIDGQPS
jgi:MFS family permease